MRMEILLLYKVEVEVVVVKVVVVKVEVVKVVAVIKAHFSQSMVLPKDLIFVEIICG